MAAPATRRHHRCRQDQRQGLARRRERGRRSARSARSPIRRRPTAPTRISTSRGSGISSRDSLAEPEPRGARSTRSPSPRTAPPAPSSTADPDGDGLSLPILDYEYPGPDELAAEYDRVRPDFSESLSPRLPGGLNLGAQIFWQERRFPKAFEAAAALRQLSAILGVAALRRRRDGDVLDGRAFRHVESARAHLVEPRRRSSAGRRSSRRFAPPSTALGPVRPALAKKLGLDPATAVHCGIHDSSASLLPHLKARTPPFAVVSTGTWVIIFAAGGDIEHLDPKRDTLANVSAFGDPVACAPLHGRTRVRASDRTATRRSRAQTISTACLASASWRSRPSPPGIGPFPHGKGRWTHPPETLSPGERNAAASLYLALMTAESLSLIGAGGTDDRRGPVRAKRALLPGALGDHRRARSSRPTPAPARCSAR